MSDYFEIPVTFQGEELSFNSRLLLTSYHPRIEVQLGEQIICFEPDENGNYRPILGQAQLDKYPEYDIGLLKTIAGVIESHDYN